MISTIYLYLSVGLIATLVVLGSHFYQTREKLFGGSNIPEWSWKNRWVNVKDRIILPFFAVAVITLLWPFVLFFLAKEILGHFKNSPVSKTQEKVFEVRQHHLIEKYNLQELECREIMEDPMQAVPEIPFGHLNSAWIAFKENIQTNDELWFFKAEESKSDLKALVREGYVIKRRGKFVDNFVTRVESIEL